MSSEGIHGQSPSKTEEDKQISMSKDENPLEFEWGETITDSFPFQQVFEDVGFFQNLQEQDIQNQQIHSNQEIRANSQAGLFLDHLEIGYNKYDQYEEDQCDYCDNKDRQFYEHGQIIKRLYSKYASSQNYYYTRDINEILSNGRTHAVIEFKDAQTADFEAEYLASFYDVQEEKQMSRQLMEYYKFHRDKPRLFMLPVTIELEKYHAKKRRYDYYRVAKLIELENAKNPQLPPKAIIGEKPPLRTNESSGPHSEDDGDDEDQIRNNEPGQIEGNLLVDISSFNFKSLHSQQDEGKIKEENNIQAKKDKKSADQKLELGEFKVNQEVYQKLPHGTEKDRGKEKFGTQTKPRIGLNKDEQQSQTLQELNLKLGEIVTSQSRINTQNFSLSKMNEDDNKFFDGKDLDHFLAFLNNTKQLKQIEVQNIPQNNVIQSQQDQKKQIILPLGGARIREEPQRSINKTANTLETARGQVDKQQKIESTQKNKLTKEITDHQGQIIGKPVVFMKETSSNEPQLQQQKQPKKRANLQLKLDDIDYYSADNKDLQYDQSGGTFGATVPQGVTSLSVRSARETATLQEAPQPNYSGPLSCSAALTKVNFKSLQKSNISPFFKGEKSNSQSQKKGIKDKLTSPKNDVIPNKSQKQGEVNINSAKQSQQQFLQPSSPSQNSAIIKPLVSQQQNQFLATKQQQLQQSLQQQQQLHYSNNNMRINSVSQNSFAQKLDTKESQLYTPRQPQQQSQLTATAAAVNNPKVPVIKCPTNNSKPQISPRGIIQVPKNAENKDELLNKLSTLNQQQQLSSQQANQIFQQYLQANTAAFLRKSSSSNNNSKINVNTFQKKKTQPLASQPRQQSSQMLNGSNPKNQKVLGNQKQLKFKLKLDLLDNSKEKSSQGLLNNSSSQNTFPANLHNSNNSNTPYLKDPLSQRSCSSKNIEQQTPKYNFYEIFRQQIASQAYSSAIQNSTNTNSNSLKANNPINQLATSAKGTALHMLNLINAQQAQSRALAQAQQNKQQSPSSSPSNRQTKAQPMNPSTVGSQLQVPGNYLQKQIYQPSDAEGFQQQHHLSVSRKISPKNQDQRDYLNSQKQYVLPEENTYSAKNIISQSPSHSSANPLQQVLSVNIIKQIKKKDDLTFNQLGDERASISNKNSLDQTSQRKVINIMPNSTTRSENHTRKNSQINQSNKVQQQQQQPSIAAGLGDVTKQISRNSSLEINNPSFLQKKSPQFLKYDSNEVSKNINNLILQNTELNQQIPHVPISMQSARNFKQDGVPLTIPLPKPGGGGGGGTNSGRGQLPAYHQPRPLISQVQMQAPSGQFYDLSNHESGVIPNTTGVVSNNISKLQQSGINPNAVGGGRIVNQSNTLFNSSQMPSNSALASFAILNNASTVNQCLDHLGQSQQQQTISQRIHQTATLRHQAQKSQQQIKSQPYSHLWQSQAQDKSNQLTIQIQQQTPSAASVPQSCNNIGVMQPSMNSGSLSVRVNPNGGNALGGTATKMSSPKADKKVVCLHKHTKSENLVNLLSHSEMNLIQNQLSQQQTQGIHQTKKQIKNQPHVTSNEGIKQQPLNQQQPSNSASFAEGNQVFLQPNLMNLLHFNNSNAFSNRNTNNYENYNANNIQEQPPNIPKNNEAIMFPIGSSHLITPRVSCSPLGGVFSDKVQRDMKNKKQSVASPLSTRSGQINFQRDQFSSTNNSSNANTNSQNNNTNNQNNNTNSQNNNNMPNQNSSSNNNSTSHQANSSLNYQQPPTTTQPQSATQLPPSNSQTSSTAKKHLMHGQISSLFTVSPSALTGQIIGASQTPSLPASFISNKKTKKKSMF